MDEITIYVSCGSDGILLKLRETLPTVKFIDLPSTQQSFTLYTVEALEKDKDGLASKIEFLFADLPVIANYRTKLTNLKWANTHWNGVDVLMKTIAEGETLPTFTLTKLPGRFNADLLTEYVIGYILAFERKMFGGFTMQKETKWGHQIYEQARTLSQISIGILGVGDIGMKLAQVCKTFGMTVWGLTRKQRTADTMNEHVDYYRTMDGLDDVLMNSDFIVNLLPSTPKTRDLLSGAVLKSCEAKNSVLINVGRGDIIDENSIVKAVKEGWIGGAVLDTFQNEPLPVSSELWSLPNVFVTPHISAWSLSGKFTENIIQTFVDNFNRYCEGRPLQNVLDWHQGY